MILVITLWICVVAIVLFCLVKKKWFLLTLFAVSFILATNLLAVAPVFFGLEPLIGYEYSYSNKSKTFEFTEIPSKGEDIAMLERRRLHFIQNNPVNPDTVVYRRFKMNPFEFWKWKEFFTHPRWDYPLGSPF